MKTILLLAALVLSPLALADHHGEAKKTEEAKKSAPAPYRHVVLFKFKDDASKEAVAKIEKDFAALKTKIKTITHLEWGTNVSPENHDQGFTHCFIVSFQDKAGLEAYLPHKDHKTFVETLLPSLDKVLVIDFVPQK